MEELDNIFEEVISESVVNEIDVVREEDYSKPFKHWIHSSNSDNIEPFKEFLETLNVIFKRIPGIRTTNNMKYHPKFSKIDMDQNNLPVTLKNCLIFDVHRPSYIMMRNLYNVIDFCASMHGVSRRVMIDDSNMETYGRKNVSSFRQMTIDVFENMCLNEPTLKTGFGGMHWFDMHQADADEREIKFCDLEMKCKMQILRDMTSFHLDNTSINCIANEMEELCGLFNGLICESVSRVKMKMTGIHRINFRYMYMGMAELRAQRYLDQKPSMLQNNANIFVGKTTVYRITDGRIVIMCSEKNHGAGERGFICLTLSYRKKTYNWESIEKSLCDIIFSSPNNTNLGLDEKIARLRVSLFPLEYTNKRKLMRLWKS
jgi:hypothetical protein